MLQSPRFTVGSDPEGFLYRSGRIIGAERFIPAQGLRSHSPLSGETLKEKAVILDGVQFELNPMQGYGYPDLALQIGGALESLNSHLRGSYNAPRVTYEPVVTVEADELAGLSEQARIFHCNKSLNVYGLKAEEGDASKILMRGAGGHFHYGLGDPIYRPYNPETGDAGVDNRVAIVPLLDICLGNTLVLFDRYKLMSERRRYYGLAGEHRLPPYGLEYRTPSNFWLRSPFLLDFAIGLSRLAISIFTTTVATGKDLEQELYDSIDMDNVITAIQKNNFDMAMTNFEALSAFVTKYVPDVNRNLGLRPNNIKHIIRLAELVEENGVEYGFVSNGEPWESLDYNNPRTWDYFITNYF